MKAAVVTEQGLRYTDAPKPTPKPHELLIKVKAASLNRADLAVASGHRHGTVGGACITALKFFFNGAQKIRPLLTAASRDVYEPSTDGLSLNTYAGADSNSLDINGELNKLAYNISFGHGIHAGIHFRSSTYWSILLGEQVALSVLQDRAKSYNEPFTISIKKFDGTTATISNQ